ncbi:hypothetical protein A3B87_01790 [Candidatus Kuenenbacteria bacterium RIFCSPHIGHO2_02_FULL_39_13]|uniref:LysM domain-containing protein n=1 Tax=Candidatus Kuenenbacteria bacterium RIFCSPHIGHO2_02_FULL_39_13 TaxID=1798561 RepID=A0A1F6FN87_9BACT|nr:MAG: hypothetical protein A3B87_01790 [Candidatus Kuenenbacteria bacterium RIFCSPHIGHO2_02_FULL_39_13]
MLLITGCVFLNNKKLTLDNELKNDNKSEEDRVFLLDTGTNYKSYKNTDNILKYTFMAGDTLWDLSEKYYGHATDWRKITFSDGSVIENHYQIRIGAKINVPDYKWELKNLKDGYYIQNDVVHFNDIDYFDDYNEDRVLKSANANKIDVLDYGYAKDNNNLYYRGNIIDSISVDLESIEALNELYIKDKNNVYCKKYMDTFADQMSLLKGADAKDFVVIAVNSYPSRYARDNNNVYQSCEKISSEDNDIYSFYKDREIKDENFKYTFSVDSGRRIPNNADVGSYEFLGYQYSKDKNHVYHNNRIMSDKPESAKYLGGNYVTDGEHVYIMGFPTEKLDINSFEYLKYEFAKDKNGVYRNSTLILGASPDTIKIINKYYVMDDKNLYFVNYDNKNFAFDNLDYDTFVILATRFVKDKSHVYYQGSIIPEADVGSFECLGEWYQKDKNFVYFQGEIIEEADADSFLLINGYFGKDKHHSYFLGEPSIK